MYCVSADPQDRRDVGIRLASRDPDQAFALTIGHVHQLGIASLYAPHQSPRSLKCERADQLRECEILGLQQ
jgi:hypothetical protein